MHKLDVIGIIGSNDVKIKDIGLWASQLGNWNFLSNIPSGFSDGVDNVGGAAVETDPTVQGFAKNALPSCTAAQKLTGNGAALSCATDSVGAAGATYTGIGNITINGSNQVNTVPSPSFSGNLSVAGTLNIGYQMITLSSLPIGVPGGGTALAICPLGKKLLGGGCSSANSLLNSYPASETSWRCNGTGGPGSTVTAYAICARIGN